MEKDYYILVNGKKVEVSEEVYKAYWQLTNRENYLKRLDAKYNVLPFSSFGDYEYDILDKLADKSIDIEKIVETRELLKLLELALSKLNDEEYTLISDLYFKELSIRALAEKKHIPPSSLAYLRDKILKKVIEEAGETLMASKDGGGEHLVYEVADLWFHTMVLLAHHGLRAEDVVNELARRQGLSGLVEKASRKES